MTGVQTCALPIYEQADLRTDRHRLEQPLQPRSRYLWSVRGVFRTDGREYTLRDTPLHTAIYHPAEETLALWA